VVVALRMAGIAGQDKLNGIFSYLNEGHRWSLAIYRTQHEFTAETVRAEIARGVDGFLVGLPGTGDALAEIAKTDRPAVLLNVPSKALMRRGGNVAMVKSDAKEVGTRAADALLSQGIYRCYGYLGYRRCRIRQFFQHAVKASNAARLQCTPEYYLFAPIQIDSAGFFFRLRRQNRIPAPNNKSMPYIRIPVLICQQ
jgi:DNA-binding LacI/PurR family transcriptional regulator